MAKIDFFGIDITSTSIQIVHTDQVRGGYVIRNLSEISSDGANFLSSSSSEDFSKTKELLINIIKQSKIKTKNCVTSIQDEFVFSRLIPLPLIPDEEVDEAIHWSLKSLIPTPIEELNVTYISVGSTFIQNDKQYNNWYVVASQKEIINKYIHLFKTAGLNLLAIETEALAIARLVGKVISQDENENDTIILDIGKMHTNLLITRKGGVLFSQALASGGDVMTKVLMADYGLSVEEAEKYKNNYGLIENLGEGKVAKSIQPVADVFVGEIMRLTSYYTEKRLGKHIGKVILTGGGSLLPGFVDYIKQKTAIETDLLHIEKIFKNQSGKQKNLLAFSTAIGLSIKDT